MEKIKRLSAGTKTLDELLEGGLILGENVLWEFESGTFALEFLYAFMKQGICDGNQVIYLDFIYPPQAVMLHLDQLIKTFPAGWENRFLVLDCFSESSGQGELIFGDFYDKAPLWIKRVPSSKDPEQFHRFFGRIEREFVSPGTRLVFNSLSLMEHMWGREAAKVFFGHICPALYAYQTLAYWMLAKNAHPPEFIAIIEHMTQVVIDLSKEGVKRYVQIKKGGSRYNPKTYERHEYLAEGLKVKIL